MRRERRRRRTRRVADRETDQILRLFADTTLRLRRASRWTQRQLGDRAAISQSEVSDIEHARLPDLPIGSAIRLMTALGARVVVRVESALLGVGDRQYDAAHARMSAFVTAKLRAAGWEVASEVGVGASGAHGWIDILAFKRATRILLVVELKTELRDFGAIQRQVGWYEREAPAAARRQGWQADTVVSLLLLLDTESIAGALRFNRGLVDQEFPIRAGELGRIVAGNPRVNREVTRARAVVCVDPRSRRSDWLLRTAIDRRRSPAAYASYADFMSRVKP